MLAEWCGIAAILATSVALVPVTRIPIVYCALVYAGSWIIPLVTSYLVHAPEENHVLRQTRLFRGALLAGRSKTCITSNTTSTPRSRTRTGNGLGPPPRRLL